jgi:hypothetical protein
LKQLGTPRELIFLSGCQPHKQILYRDALVHSGCTRACVYWNGMINGREAYAFAVRMYAHRHLESKSIQEAFDSAKKAWSAKRSRSLKPVIEPRLLQAHSPSRQRFRMLLAKILACVLLVFCCWAIPSR